MNTNSYRKAMLDIDNHKWIDGMGAKIKYIHANVVWP